MKARFLTWFCFFLLVMKGSAVPQGTSAPAPAIQGIQGVKQEALESIKKVEPPTAKSATTTTEVQGVKKIDGVETIKAVNSVVPDSVKRVPPPPSTNGVSAIRAVKGVTGIDAPKQKNLESALRIKSATQTSEGKHKAAAAALFRSPPKEPTTAKNEDGRAAFQEIVEKIAPGS